MSDKKGKQKILIVDDVKDNVDILDQYFSNKGFETILANGGQEALEKIQSLHPDIVLLDIMMPDLDGYHVCEKLRKEMTAFKNMPVILVTAKDDVESKVKGLGLGADDYVTKPFDIQELSARVQTALRLKKAQDELKELNELKNQFLGMASHDIKGPIGRIEKTVEALLKNKKSLTDDQLQNLSKIKDEAEGVFNLITDLLDVVKIESDKMGIKKQEVKIDALIDEVFKMNEMTAQAKGITIDVDATKSLKVLGDPDRLIEVFENLIINAIKFTHKGKKISIRAKTVSGGAEIEISDEGVGIPNSELPKVFQRFARLTPQSTQGEKGTGLGLSICKQIVDLHHGTIAVKSEVGKGTTFTIFLPK